MKIKKTSSSHHSGYTLIEVMLALGLMSALIIPISDMYLASYEGTEDIGHYDQAFFLAQDLIEEITSKDFEDDLAGTGSFGTEEVNRSDFDDIDDYDNYGPNSPPIQITGINFDNFDAFTRESSVVNLSDVSDTNIPRSNLTPIPDGSSNFKLVTVSVSWDNGGQSQVLERIVANYK